MTFEWEIGIIISYTGCEGKEYAWHRLREGPVGERSTESARKVIPELRG